MKSMKLKTRLVAASALLSSAFGAHGATLLYQWDFDSGNGANTGTGTGGTLAANVGANSPTSGNFSAVGVSGQAGDSAFNVYNSEADWWTGTQGDAAAVGSLDLNGLAQFTMTMWIKRSGGNNVDVLNIGSTATPQSSSNPGISVGLNGTWDNGIRVGVNGSNTWTGDLWSTGTDNDWVFLAIAYDSAAGFGWTSTAMSTTYGASRNLAIITGDTTTAASLFATNSGIHDGGWWNGPGAPAIGSTGTIFLGDNGLTGLTGYAGDLDDIRIYNGLLTVSEVEAVRASAIPEPSSVLLFGFCGLGLVTRRRR